MARGTNSRGRGAAQTAEPKKLVCCRDCFWANLMQYGDNPVLADCTQKPNYYNEKFPYERDVASSLKYCGMYSYQDEREKTIQKRVSVRKYPMAAYVRTTAVEIPQPTERKTA